MKTRAAVLWGLEQKWEVEEVDLDPPGPGEVLVRLAATGLCHSDEHLVTGDLPIPLPVVGVMRVLAQSWSAAKGLRNCPKVILSS
ncbi:hypothetical protein MINTMi198_24160 [Mycobacterium intracellulare M.i.198]|nr:hypothetical protein MINTMi198_24160 [Mycobacterium intracellulare M.i.198]